MHDALKEDCPSAPVSVGLDLADASLTLSASSASSVCLQSSPSTCQTLEQLSTGLSQAGHRFPTAGPPAPPQLSSLTSEKVSRLHSARRISQAWPVSYLSILRALSLEELGEQNHGASVALKHKLPHFTDGDADPERCRHLRTLLPSQPRVLSSHHACFLGE